MMVLLCWVMSAVTIHVVKEHHHDHSHSHEHAAEHNHDESDCPVCEFDFASFLAPKHIDIISKLPQAVAKTSFGYWETPFLRERQALSLRGPPQVS